MKRHSHAARTRLASCALIAVTIIVLGTAAAASALPTPKAAPLNPDFLRYQRQLAQPFATPLWAAPGSSAARGVTPAPADVSIARGTALDLPHYAYPASYDLRTLGKLTLVRDQGSFNTCWVFATFASLESTLLPGESLNFSEDNVAVNAGFDLGAYGGGNELMAAAYLSAWNGPVYETDDPYGDGTTPAGLAPRKHVQDVLMLPNRTGPTDNATIKWALTNYGAVYSVLHWADADFKSSTNAYYSPAGAVNHAIAIVGWDDSYSRYNFVATPPGDGAFIVRNSWGSDWGDGGYFYVSYYDTRIGKENTIFTAEATSDYSGIYQYDRYGLCTSFGWDPSTTAWMANAFTARGHEALEAVSFYALVPDTTYSIYLGSGLRTRVLLDSGTIAVAGYRTIALPAQPLPNAGQKFYVIVRLTTPGLGYPIAVEYAQKNYSSAATSAAGQSYTSANGSNWFDMGAAGSPLKSNVCLKAFTVPAAPDTTPPTTTVSGIPAGWSPTAVKARFKATDTGGSGVGMTLYSIDGGPTKQGTVATVSGNGVHTLLFHSIDRAGNPGSDRNATVRIDTSHPTTRALAATSASYRGYATLKYEVVDAAPNGGTATVTIKIKTLAGRVVKTYLLGRKKVNATLSLRMYCAIPRGTYRYYIYAKDSAGNVQSRAGYDSLVVK